MYRGQCTGGYRENLKYAIQVWPQWKREERKQGLGKKTLSLQQNSKVCRGLVENSGAKITLQKSSPPGSSRPVLVPLTHTVTGWGQSVENVALAQTVIASEHSSWGHQSNTFPAAEIWVVHFHGGHSTFSICESHILRGLAKREANESSGYNLRAFLRPKTVI